LRSLWSRELLFPCALLFHLAEALDRFARIEIFQLEELPDFDLGRPPSMGDWESALPIPLPLRETSPG